MRAATLFSGIGAPEVAMPGWRWLWHAEIEKFPSAVMRVRHPESVNLGDVTADDFCERAIKIGRPDVLVFGSPCQSYSVAGKRLGLDDPRGNLALVALGIIDRLRPTWFVFENVPGLLSSYSGSDETYREVSEGPDGTECGCDEDSDFAAFLATVNDIGYCLAWTVLDAQFAGLAQRRDRVFVVGHLGAEWPRAAAVLLEPESLCGHPPTRREAREDVAGTLASRTSAGGGLGTDFDLSGGIVGTLTTGAHPGSYNGQDAYSGHLVPQAFGGNRTSGALDVATALGAHGGPMGRMNFASETLIAHSLRADGFDAGEDGTGRGTPLVPVAFSVKDYGADAGELSPTLRSGGHDTSHANGGCMPAVAYALRSDASRSGEASTPSADAEGRVRLRNAGFNVLENMAPTVDASQPHSVFQSTGVRRLMPVECERLQGFPDGYTAVTYRGKPAKDGPRYKAIGNAMAIPCIRWILNRIEWIERHVPSAERVSA